MTCRTCGMVMESILVDQSYTRCSSCLYDELFAVEEAVHKQLTLKK